MDGCGWFYEKWTDIGLGVSRTRKPYIDKAENILKDVDFKTACLIINNL